jgi:RND family efflux transporter MFP subunit
MKPETETKSAGGGASRPRRSWAIAIARGLATMLLAAAAIAGGLGLQHHLIATRPAAPTQASGERAPAVETVIARVADVRPMLTLYGQIAAGRSVDLRVLVGGEVTAVSPALVEGGRVKAGDMLIAVDRFEYEGALVRARADLKEAEARITETRARIALEKAGRVRAEEQRLIAERELDRLKKLRKTESTSEAAVDQSRMKLSQAAASVEAQANQLRVLEAQIAREDASIARLKWSVGKAERDIRSTELTAPFEGLVSNASAEMGRLVNVNDRIATLVDLSRIEVRFTLTDAQYGRLVAGGGALEGREVEVVWTGGATELAAKGMIDRISPVVSAATGGFDVYARLERSAATEAMRPGAFVRVLTPDVSYAEVVQVPHSALHPGNRLFIVGADKRLLAVPVEVAGFSGSDVLLRGAIPEGATVMTTRRPDAGPGLLVDPR